MIDNHQHCVQQLVLLQPSKLKISPSVGDVNVVILQGRGPEWWFRPRSGWYRSCWWASCSHVGLGRQQRSCQKVSEESDRNLMALRKGLISAAPLAFVRRGYWRAVSLVCYNHL